MIYNANNVFADHPWQGLDADRDTLLQRAWDDPAARWNQRIGQLRRGQRRPRQRVVDPRRGRPAARRHRPARRVRPHRTSWPAVRQSFLDVFVDRTRCTRPARPSHGSRGTGDDTDLRKSFFGKNMLHNNEHALIMYLHGRALEGTPGQALLRLPRRPGAHRRRQAVLVRRGGETRTVTRDVPTLPGSQGRRGRVHRDRRGRSLTLPNKTGSADAPASRSPS